MAGVSEQFLPSLDCLLGRVFAGELCVGGFCGASKSLEFSPAFIVLHEFDGCGGLSMKVEGILLMSESDGIVLRQ